MTTTIPVRAITDFLAVESQVLAAARALRSAGTHSVIIELLDFGKAHPEIVVRPVTSVIDNDPSSAAWLGNWVTDDAVAAEVQRLVRGLMPSAARSLGAKDAAGVAYVHRDAHGRCVRTTVRAPAGAETVIEHPLLADVPPDIVDRDLAWRVWVALGGPRSYGAIVVVPQSGEASAYGVEDCVVDAGWRWNQRVQAYAPLRAGDADRELPEDTDEVVRQIHRARRAPHRHASRFRAARAAIMQYVLNEDWSTSQQNTDIQRWVLEMEDDPHPPSLVESWHARVPRVAGRAYTADEAERIIRVIASMELHGVGGLCGIEGGASTTMSWRHRPADNEQTDRARVNDELTWDDAIQATAQVASSVTPEAVLLAVPFVRPHDLEWPMAYALDRAYQHRDDSALARRWSDVARRVMSRATSLEAPINGGAALLGHRYGVIASRE